MTVRAGNLFADVSAASATEEAFSEIFAQPGLKIERIISQGQASPPEFWYDQAWNEWVIVLKGGAKADLGALFDLGRLISRKQTLQRSEQRSASGHKRFLHLRFLNFGLLVGEHDGYYAGRAGCLFLRDHGRKTKRAGARTCHPQT